MPIPIAAIGATMAAGSLAGSILGKKKKAKGPDIGYLTGQIKQGSEKARGYVGQEFGELAPVTTQYGQGIEELGTGYEAKTKGLAEEYQKNLGQLGEADKTARDLSVALKSKESYGAVPMQQQMIREQLAASGGMRTGAASKLLAQPTMQAAQDVSRAGTEMDISNLERQSARQEQGVNTLYQSQAGAALTKLGLDQEKLTTLMENGRADIISKYAKLAGIDEAELNALLGLEGMRTQVDMANTTAANARQQEIWNQLGGLGSSLMTFGAANKAPTGPSADTLRFVRG